MMHALTRTLYGRLALVFAGLTLVCAGFTAWLFLDATSRHQQEVLQRLSKDLAAHIAGHTDLVKQFKWNRPAVDDLFHMLMVVNPGIEVYLLKANGHIDAHVAPPGRVRRESIDVAPIQAFLAGGTQLDGKLPLLGDDPRGDGVRKIFSAAPLKDGDTTVGYLYVILAGEDYDRLAANVRESQAMTTAVWLMGGLTVLTLSAGLIAFALITRRLRRLGREVRDFDVATPETLASPPTPDEKNDEIGQLRQTFHHMATRIAAQVGELKRQDQMRREMVANISHDLRTPLTSLQGYLETLSLKAGQVSVDERERYLDVALRQSRKVSKLAQELFELAKLECEVTLPLKEPFALPELINDVLQKFELAARNKEVSLQVHIPDDLPPVLADLGMIERVLTNLLDNALRHTPAGGTVRLELHGLDGNVQVRVADTGSGIPDALRPQIFERPSPLRDGTGRTSGGLGLLIVKRILSLHDSSIRLETDSGAGAAFSFALPTA